MGLPAEHGQERPDARPPVGFGLVYVAADQAFVRADSHVEQVVETERRAQVGRPVDVAHADAGGCSRPGCDRRFDVCVGLDGATKALLVPEVDARFIRDADLNAEGRNESVRTLRSSGSK